MKTLCSLLCAATLFSCSAAMAVIDDDHDREAQTGDTEMGKIATGMDEIVKMLRELELGAETQARQAAVLDEIDILVKKAEMEMNVRGVSNESAAPNRNPQPGQPKPSQEMPSEGGADSAEQLDPSTLGGSEEGEADEPRGPGIELWIPELPPRERERLSQEIKEEFAERYRTLLRLYFQNLSEQEN